MQRGSQLIHAARPASRSPCRSPGSQDSRPSDHLCDSTFTIATPSRRRLLGATQLFPYCSSTAVSAAAASSGLTNPSSFMIGQRLTAPRGHATLACSPALPPWRSFPCPNPRASRPTGLQSPPQASRPGVSRLDAQLGPFSFSSTVQLSWEASILVSTSGLIYTNVQPGLGISLLGALRCLSRLPSPWPSEPLNSIRPGPWNSSCACWARSQRCDLPCRTSHVR